VNPIEVYCFCDEFTRFLNKKSLGSRAGRKSKLSTAEFMTISFLKNTHRIPDNKALYDWLSDSKYFSSMFRSLPSYQQFNEGLNKTFSYFVLATAILVAKNKSKTSKYFVVDSTCLPICSNGYRYRCKMGKGLANSSKNLNGWWHGFKLHLIINDNMEIVSMRISSASTKDFNVLDESFVKGIVGYLVGDKGYISRRVAKYLKENFDIELLTLPRKNMKKPPVQREKIKILKKRPIVETVFSKLKNCLGMVTSRARSLLGYMTNVFSALFAYSIQLKTSIEISQIYEILIS